MAQSDEILDALKKGPMTMEQLSDHTHIMMGSLYAALGMLKSKGKVFKQKVPGSNLKTQWGLEPFAESDEPEQSSPSKVAKAVKEKGNKQVAVYKAQPKLAKGIKDIAMFKAGDKISIQRATHADIVIFTEKGPIDMKTGKVFPMTVADYRDARLIQKISYECVIQVTL